VSPKRSASFERRAPEGLTQEAMSRRLPSFVAGKVAKAKRGSQRRGYSIRVASRLTGISADKLRIWERRYGFPSPVRTATGLRVYTDDDVQRLLLVARAMEAGYRAGDAIAESPEKLKRVVSEAAEPRDSQPAAVVDVQEFLRMLRADEIEPLRDGLRQAVASLGPKRFVTDVAAPLVQATGDAWHDGRITVRHEHLLSATLSTQLRLLLAAYEQPRGGPVILLTTLPHEQHGLGIEMAALYLALNGFTIRMLGVDTPIAEVVEAALGLRADVVGISVSTAADPRATGTALRSLLGKLPGHVELWLGGRAVASLTLDDARVRRATTWAEVDELTLTRGRLRA
jgi:MerR family transcriptional regulator, light-induced transcriptional regulator